MNQNENKPMTAADVYDQKQRELSPGVKRELRLSKIGIINLMEQYAAQQVKLVTEERDKAVELLAEILQEDGNRRFLYSAERSIITNFLNSLNAAKEGGE